MKLNNVLLITINSFAILVLAEPIYFNLLGWNRVVSILTGGWQYLGTYTVYGNSYIEDIEHIYDFLSFVAVSDLIAQLFFGWNFKYFLKSNKKVSFLSRPKFWIAIVGFQYINALLIRRIHHATTKSHMANIDFGIVFDSMVFGGGFFKDILFIAVYIAIIRRTMRNDALAKNRTEPEIHQP